MVRLVLMVIGAASIDVALYGFGPAPKPAPHRDRGTISIMVDEPVAVWCDFEERRLPDGRWERCT